MKTNKKRNRGVVLWVFEWGEREREEEEEEEKEDWGLGFKKSKKKGLKMKNMRDIPLSFLIFLLITREQWG